jgi:hypothetical protein
MTRAGDRVRTPDGFLGVLISGHGQQGGPGFSYMSMPADLNIAVYAIWNQETGEVRYSTNVESAD